MASHIQQFNVFLAQFIAFLVFFPQHLNRDQLTGNIVLFQHQVLVSQRQTARKDVGYVEHDQHRIRMIRRVICNDCRENNIYRDGNQHPEKQIEIDENQFPLPPDANSDKSPHKPVHQGKHRQIDRDIQRRNACTYSLRTVGQIDIDAFETHHKTKQTIELIGYMLGCVCNQTAKECIEPALFIAHFQRCNACNKQCKEHQ